MAYSKLISETAKLNRKIYASRNVANTARLSAPNIIHLGTEYLLKKDITFSCNRLSQYGYPLIINCFEKSLRDLAHLRPVSPIYIIKSGTADKHFLSNLRREAMELLRDSKNIVTITWLNYWRVSTSKAPY